MASEPERPPEDDSEPRQHIAGKDARGGEIILRKRWMRIVFIVGLVGIALLAVALRLGPFG